MKKTRQWAPNPYAIAQLLLDVLDIEPVYKATGEGADKFLRRAFNAKGELVALDTPAELIAKADVTGVDRPTLEDAVLALTNAPTTI